MAVALSFHLRQVRYSTMEMFYSFASCVQKNLVYHNVLSKSKGLQRQWLPELEK